MGIPDHLTCFLRNLYAGQEATVRTGHGTTDWFQIRKGVQEGCILSPCLFTLYAEYIMRNTGLEEAQAGIKIASRNINNLRYADNTTLTCLPHPEPPSHLPPHTIPLGHPSAPAPSILRHASNLDWRFISYMILYMFQCHSTKSSHPFPLPQSPKDCSIYLCLLK